MSSAQSTASDRQHKVINLYGEQIEAYQTAREAVLNDCDGDMTEGEIIATLARAYTSADTVPEVIAGMVVDHASNYDDLPVLAHSTLQKMDNKSLRKLAAEADTDSISGRDTQSEWYSFFGKTASNHD